MRYFLFGLAWFVLGVMPGYAGDSQLRPASAWWYSIAFVPDKEVIRNVHISRLDPQWVKASDISVSDLSGKVSWSDIQRFKHSKFRFSTNRDLDGDGQKESIVVGVYRRADNLQGRFLAIFKNGIPVSVFTRDGDPGFSGLLWHKGVLRWYSCMDCGEFESVVWSGGHFLLE